MYRVLIADDEEIERLSFSRKLKKYFGESCEVFHAENGMQAILAVDKNDTPIVIMDIGMPGMNGVEAAEWIRKSHPDCVIIFLTAYDDFSYAKRAVSLHALEYLLKPCDDEELIPVMEEAMRQVDLCRKKAESPAGGTGFAGSSFAAAGGGGRGREGGTDGEGIRSTEAGNGRDAEDDPGQEPENGYSRVAAAIRAYVRENYNRDISMQDAARAMNYSEVYFCRLFKKYTGQTFLAYVNSVRTMNFYEELLKSDESITQLMVQNGLTNYKVFMRVFKEMYGTTPQKIRKSAVKPAAKNAAESLFTP